MKLARQFMAASIIAGSSLLPVSGALADTVDLNAVGPGSSQDVTINNSISVVETNVNSVVVTNTNVQEATTGDVEATDNTSVGGLSSGSATNTNGTSTTVSVDNQPSGGVGGSTDGQASGGNDGNTSTPSNGSAQPNGSVLGSSTTAGGLGGAVAILPVTGPTQPVDVSALRAAWQPHTGTPAQAVVSQNRISSLLMFAIAALFSALGALGNVAYLRRKQGRS